VVATHRPGHLATWHVGYRLAVAIGLLIPGPALAAPVAVELFECTRDGQWRTVTIRRDAQATPPACDVRYQKRTELFDHDQVLWRGANGLTFCRERATALTAKLTGWGWQYVGGAPSTVADDTDFRAIEPAPNDSTWVGQPANSSTVLSEVLPGSQVVVAGQNASSALVDRGDSSGALGAGASQAPVAQSSTDLNVTPALLSQTIIEAHAERLRASLAQSYRRALVGSLKNLRAYGDLDGDGDTDAALGYITHTAGGGVNVVVSLFVNVAGSGYVHGGSNNLPPAPARWPVELRIENALVVVGSTDHLARLRRARPIDIGTDITFDSYALRNQTIVRIAP
jgi:hypothetical protein